MKRVATDFTAQCQPQICCVLSTNEIVEVEQNVYPIILYGNAIHYNDKSCQFMIKRLFSVIRISALLNLALTTQNAWWDLLTRVIFVCVSQVIQEKTANKVKNPQYNANISH